MKFYLPFLKHQSLITFTNNKALTSIYKGIINALYGIIYIDKFNR